MNVVEPIMPEVKRTFGGVGVNPVADRGVELDRLFGRPDPKGSQVRKYEQPWHRFAAEMYARGASQRAIAEACDKGPNHVSALVKNAWFQETVLEIQREVGGFSDVMELLKGETMNSVQNLVELRDSPTTPATVRATISFGILHQVLGKPTQRVETKDVPTSDDPVAEVARLEAENLRLQSSSATSHAGQDGLSPLAPAGL